MLFFFGDFVPFMSATHVNTVAFTTALDLSRSNPWLNAIQRAAAIFSIPLSFSSLIQRKQN